MGWIDSLRGVATLLVLVLHASLIVERFSLEPLPELLFVNRLFSPYRMALLMLLSGLLLAPALSRAQPEYTLRKVSTLLWPFLLWTALYGVLVHPQGPDEPVLWIGGSYLWFILFLFTYYLIAWPLRHLPALGLAVLCFVGSLLAPDDTKYAERYLFLFGFFLLGHHLRRHPLLLERLTTGVWPWLALPLAITLSWGSAIAGGINYRVEYLLPTLAGLVLLVAVARRLDDRAIAQRLRFVGRHSVVFFVVHYPLMHGVVRGGIADGITSPTALSAIALVLSLAVCWGLARLRERLPPLELLFSLPMQARAPRLPNPLESR